MNIFHHMNIFLVGQPTPRIKSSNLLFLRASALLRADGHTVWPPDEQAVAAYNGTAADGAPLDLRDDLAQALTWICDLAEAVLVLPSWRDTTRNRATVATARALGLPIWAFSEFILHGDKASRIEVNQ